MYDVLHKQNPLLINSRKRNKPQVHKLINPKPKSSSTQNSQAHQLKNLRTQKLKKLIKLKLLFLFYNTTLIFTPS